MPYVLICHGGIGPRNMKIIMYEGNSKYALRGSTMFCNDKNSYGGEFKSSENSKTEKILKEFLVKKMGYT